MVDNYRSKQETAGYLVSTLYYSRLNKYEEQNLAKLEKEYNDLTASLQQALNEGYITKFSEAWYDMVGQINSTEEAILDAKTAMVEYNNEIRQLKWSYFDTLQEYIGNAVTEAEFLTDLFSDYKLFEEAGAFTDLGQASVGLAAIRNNIYMAQADAYREEMLKVNKELAKDPNNTILINRREELLELQQQSIQAAQQEKQAIKSLVQEGYETMLDYVSTLIDKYKEALNAEKDLYDYQKNIADQTKNIANLQKQLDALSGDDSEENRNRLQQLRANLEEAQQNLQDTEYERYISDQQNMLDTFYGDLEKWVNDRLDQLELIVREQIDAANANAQSIIETIGLEAGNVGYVVSTSLADILDPNATGTVGNLVGYYGDLIGVTDGEIYNVTQEGFENVNWNLTTTIAAINAVEAKIQSMIDASDAQAKAERDAVNATKLAQQTGNPAVSTGASSGSGSGSTAKSGATSGSGSSSGSGFSSASGGGAKAASSSSSWGSWFVHKRDTYPKGKLDTETSIVDRLKLHDFDSSYDMRARYYKAMGGSGVYSGTAAQNKWMIAQMRAHGYKSGSTSIPSNRYAWTQENGTELIYRKSDGAILTPLGRGDAVFTADMTKNLWEMANGAQFAAMRPMNVSGPNKAGDVVFSGDIQMYGVNDPVQFAENLKQALKTDDRVKKIIQSQTLGVAMGKNSLSARKY